MMQPVLRSQQGSDVKWRARTRSRDRIIESVRSRAGSSVKVARAGFSPILPCGTLPTYCMLDLITRLTSDFFPLHRSRERLRA